MSLELQIRRRWYAVVFILIFNALIVRVECDCYNRNGVFARDTKEYTNAAGPLELLSCENGTNNCCLWNEKCGSNLLCQSKTGTIARQYCHDKNWSNCSSLAPEWITAGVQIIDCGSNIYCAVNSTCCTNSAAKRYFVDPETGAVQDASLSRSSTKTVTWWSIDSSAIFAATSVPSKSALSAATTTASSAVPTVAISSQTSGSVVASTQPPASSPPVSSSNKLSAGAGAGVAIGCIAAAAIIATLAWLFFRERKKRRSLQAQIVPGYQYDQAQKDMYAHSQAPMVETMPLHELAETRARQELRG